MVVVPNGPGFLMVNVKRLIIALYEEFDGITVYAAADHLISRGWTYQAIQIENENWSIKDLFYEYDGRVDLARDLKPVKWTGGPPNDDCVYCGSFLTVLLDFILLRKVLKECQLTSNG